MPTKRKRRRITRKEAEALIQKQVDRQINAENRIDISSTSTKPECDTGHAFAQQAENQTFDQRACITFIHHRRTACDIDNLFIKHLLDSIVDSGILIDDSPKYVAEIRHRQIKTKETEYIKIIIEPFVE